MNRFFQLYQYLGPAIALPLGYILWLWHYGGDHRLTLAALAVPVVFAYVIPALGTNRLRLWDFNTRLKLGRFRPHHGFVFGSATSLLALACAPQAGAAFSIAGLLQSAFVVASVIGFWNWLYDAYALRAGFILIRRQPYQRHLGHEALAMEYAPVFFGSFGAVYGAYLYMLAQLAAPGSRPDLLWWLLLAGIACALVVPVACYVAACLIRYGETGLDFAKE